MLAEGVAVATEPMLLEGREEPSEDLVAAAAMALTLEDTIC